MNFIEILKSKPHNLHYLNRYIKLINYIKNSERINGYTEKHHICPKAKDLFPEYKSFKEHPWNMIVLPARYHFIAHWLLWKAYGGSQTYAFVCMVNQKSKYQTERYNRVSSRTYAAAKASTRDMTSKSCKGLALYVDIEGNKVRCNTSDPRVISGELVSASKGRKRKSYPMSQESKTNLSRLTWKDKFVKLYKLDVKIEIWCTYTRDEIKPYIDDGWSMTATKEYRSAVARHTNTTRVISEETKRKIGDSNRGRQWSMSNESRIAKRTSNKSNIKLFYSTETLEFIELDFIFAENHHIKVFSSSGSYRLIFNEQGNRFPCSNLVPTPPGFYDDKPTKILRVIDTITNTLEYKQVRDILPTDIKVIVPNGDRIKIFNKNTQTNEYLTYQILNDYIITNIK